MTPTTFSIVGSAVSVSCSRAVYEYEQLSDLNGWQLDGRARTTIFISATSSYSFRLQLCPLGTHPSPELVLLPLIPHSNCCFRRAIRGPRMTMRPSRFYKSFRIVSIVCALFHPALHYPTPSSRACGVHMCSILPRAYGCFLVDLTVLSF